MGTRTINLISAFLVSIGMLIAIAVALSPYVYGVYQILCNNKIKGWSIMIGWTWLVFFIAAYNLIIHFNKKKKDESAKSESKVG